MTPEAPVPDAVVTVLAPAKLTVSLRLTGVRADGYLRHDFQTRRIDDGERVVAFGQHQQCFGRRALGTQNA